MQHIHREILQTFDKHSLPDLDVVVLGALELFDEVPVPHFDTSQFARPLVLGSVNAEVTGRILFEKRDAIYADEGTYKEKIKNVKSVVVISASGKKHAIEITKHLKEKNISSWLLTNNPEAPAREHVNASRVLVFPRNREPYTYNTSTYMGIILGSTREDPAAIHEFITTKIVESIPENLGDYDAFYLIIPPAFVTIRDMFLTKFDELFGGRVSGRVFTFEQTKHAKTVVPSEKELFISFGVENTLFGGPNQRLHIPLPEHAGYVAMMAVGYYVIGHIQKQQPPYFKKHIQEYTAQASEIFGHVLKPIVE